MTGHDAQGTGDAAASTPAADVTPATPAADVTAATPGADRFPDSDAAAVAKHMNHDHTGDALLIVQAFGGRRDATAAVVSDLDKLGIVFDAQVDGATVTVRVPWKERIEERPGLRPAIAQMYRDACAELGIPARGETQH